MTFTEWIDSLPDDERAALCTNDAWKAGAMQTFAALIDGGFITEPYAAIAQKEIAEILSGA